MSLVHPNYSEKWGDLFGCCEAAQHQQQEQYLAVVEDLEDRL